MPLNSDNNSPLVIDMHGGGDDVYQQYNTSRFANISELDSVVIAYPQGYGNLWNQTDGLCCSDEDDFGFILKMILGSLGDKGSKSEYLNDFICQPSQSTGTFIL